MMHCQATTSLAQFSLFVRGWWLPLLHSSPSFHPSSSFILPSVAEVVNLHCDGRSSQQLSQLAIHSRNIPLLQKWGLTQGFSRYGCPDNGLKERLECSFRSLHPRTKLEKSIFKWLWFDAGLVDHIFSRGCRNIKLAFLNIPHHKS